MHNTTKIVYNVRTARGYIKIRGRRGAVYAGFFPEQRMEIEPIADGLEFHRRPHDMYICLGGWPSKMTG